jgi:DNA-binding CsgD family transcriptional regulator
VKPSAAAVRESIERDTEYADKLVQRMRDDDRSTWPVRLLDDLEAAGTLTRSEKECLRYMSVGLTREQTATALYLSVETVKSHLLTARYKLRAKNTTHACCLALRQGLIA